MSKDLPSPEKKNYKKTTKVPEKRLQKDSQKMSKSFKERKRRKRIIWS